MEEWQEVIKYRTTPTWIYVHGIRNNMYMTVMYLNTNLLEFKLQSISSCYNHVLPLLIHVPHYLYLLHISWVVGLGG